MVQATTNTHISSNNQTSKSTYTKAHTQNTQIDKHRALTDQALITSPKTP